MEAVSQTGFRKLISAGTILILSAALALGPATSSSEGTLGAGYVESFAAAKCGLLEADVVGTSRADKLRGERGSFGNVFAGLGGADTIDGNKWPDIVCAGAGNDVVRGWKEDDSLHGEKGNDSLRGGSGEDALFGEGGKDVLGGGEGRDVFVGGGGRDTCIGGSGKDGATSCEVRRTIEVICKDGSIWARDSGRCVKQRRR